MLEHNHNHDHGHGHHVCHAGFAFLLSNDVRTLFQNPRKILNDYIKPGNIVADIGCGPGYFSIPMAKMVGSNGKVIAVDIQEKMLDIVKRRAAKNNLGTRITTILCKNNELGITEKVDFVLTFWMVHEVKDQVLLFKQISRILQDNGRYLLVEPKIHVGGKEYAKTVKDAESNGLKFERNVKAFFSRASLFSKR
jgi:ubiquinone/menaquinone biosynthesis C-methylase UbiE